MATRKRSALRVAMSGASHEVVMKLKTTQPARRALRSLSAASTGSATRGTASAARSPLSELLARGTVASMQPLFPTRQVRRAAALEAMVMSVDEDPDQDLAGLNVMSFDTTSEAADACGMLETDAQVEYAHQPQERFMAAAVPATMFSALTSTGKQVARRRRRVAQRLDPLSSRQWGLGAIQLAQAQRVKGFKEAFDVKIAVMDTGVDSAHPDLKGTFLDERTFVSGPPEDTRGHGTHVSGIIAAATNNGIGITGTCQSRNLISLKCLGPYQAAGYYRAIRHVSDAGAQILNMSLGGGHDPTEELLIKRAIANGVIVVAAMGNESSTLASYPAAIDGVIAVGASTEVDGLADFSNTGPHINLVAPGVSILSTVPTYPVELAKVTHYDSWPGTSMATPFVAATVALCLAKKPTADLARITNALEKGADKVGGHRGFTNEFGHGRLNVPKTLARI